MSFKLWWYADQYNPSFHPTSILCQSDSFSKTFEKPFLKEYKSTLFDMQSY